MRHPQSEWRGKTASAASGAQQKARERNGPATGKETSVKQPLAGGECSRRGDQAAASTRDESIKNTLSPGGPRMPNEPSGQVAAPTQGTARVRFEFAGRAHRREFTPKLEIKRKENKVKEKEENFGQKRKKNSPQTAQKGAPKWKGAPSRAAPGSRGGTGREGLLGWRYCRDPSATHRKKRGSGVGMTNAEGRWMLAAFACVAFADGVGRRPLQKQAKPRENPHPRKSKGAAPANPREG